jgi:hypothetical protein
MSQLLKQIVLTVLAFLLASFCGADASPKNIVAFQIYQGNESLPPQYQHVQIIRGKIGKDNVAINYSRRDADKKVERNITLSGKDYEDCLKTVKATSLKHTTPAPGAPNGGSTNGFDITLTGPEKKSDSGEPSNPDDWAKLKGRIESLVNEAPEAGEPKSK